MTRRHHAIGVLVVTVAIAAALGSESAPSTMPSAAPRVDHSRDQPHDPLGEAGGAVPEGTTIFDDGIPGVANLDPALLRALRRAATDAAAAGVTFVVDSGWRSPEYQQHLLDEAVAKYGSEAEAARWVAAPDRSAHVSGDAVDLGPADAMPWLSARGAAYGLCQVYGNEPWHYERRPEAVAQGCPAMYADPTQDPRTRR